MNRPASLHGGLLARKGQAAPAATGGHPATRAGGPTRPEPAPSSSERHRLRAVPAAEDDQPVRFTLRLDRRRHTQLKILAARTGRTGQEIVLGALEAYLRNVGRPCACLLGASGGGDRSGPD